MQDAERRWVAELRTLIRDSPDFTRGWLAYHRDRAETERR
jgi:hypothetical protein